MSWHAAHPSCVGFYVAVRCTSILRGVLCHCALLIHLAWGSVSLYAAHPSCVEFCVIERCSSILRGFLCHGALHRRFCQSLVLGEARRCIGDLAKVSS